MPVREVGKDCYQWGNQKVYCGKDAKQKAIKQGIAIENTGWKEAEDSKRYLRGMRGGQLSQLQGVGKIYPSYEDLECDWDGCNTKMREVQDFQHPSYHCVNEDGTTVSAVNRLIREKMDDTIKNIRQTYKRLNLPSHTKQEMFKEEKESVKRVFSEAMRRNEENWKYILCDEHIESRFEAEDARDFAREKHEGQMYGDKPYMTHVEDVASGFEDLHLKRIAYLHDVVEDSDVTIQEIRERFGKNVSHAVDALTRRKESYFDYIQRVKENPEATQVKLADLHANLKNNPKESLAKRYRKAIDILTNTMEAETMTTNLPILILTGVAFALSIPYFLDSRGNKV